MHPRSPEDIMVDTEFISTQRFTQAEFEEWVMSKSVPSDLYRYELIRGHVVMEPPAGYPHGETEAAIVRLLGNAVAACHLGKVYGSSQGFNLPNGDTLEPDAAFVSHERLLAAPPPEVGKFLRVVPELVVEVLSRSTRSRDQRDKRDIYRSVGVREYWMVDPIARVVLRVTFAQDGDHEVKLRPGETLQSSVIAALVTPVSDLFES
jgi:Uma2 family endonuclease